MAVQSHAALAEIRDALLETYASNDAMNQLILSHLDPCAWRAQPPGQKGNGRTIAAIFAHLHNCPLKWLKSNAPHLKCPPPLQRLNGFCGCECGEETTEDPGSNCEPGARSVWL